MKLRILSVVIIGICLLFVTSCITSYYYNLEVTCDDFADNPNNESKVTLEIGDKINIELCANPSTGYEWDYEMTEDGIVMEEDHDYEEPESDIDGAAGTEVWTFEAVSAGDTEITLKYTPPDTGDMEDTWNLIITVTVE